MATAQPTGGGSEQYRDQPARPPEEQPPEEQPPAPAQPPPAQPPPAQPPPAQPPPDWSTPATLATAPPIGGGPVEPAPEQLAEPDSVLPARLERPERAERRDVRPWMVLGSAALFLLCCYGGLAITALTWGGDVYRALVERQRTVGLNQPARDGDLEFRVLGVECGISRIGDPFVNQAAVGQFCVVQLDVHNLGPRPATFSDSLQQAYGPSGDLFLPDTGAGVLANGDQQVFLGAISPGNRVSGAVVYDIPPTARIVRLRLHESPRSRGTLVKTE